MKIPIIIDEHGDTSVFLSIEEAEKYLEPIDVENGEYVAYDCEGNRLQLLPTHPRVTIRELDPKLLHTDELKEVLYRLLLYEGISEVWLNEASLEQLIDKAKDYAK